MNDFSPRAPRAVLQGIARRAMAARGLEPDFSAEALTEANALNGPVLASRPTIRDLRHLLWCSIDNDESRDLDQISVAQASQDGSIQVLVAIADVAEVVHLDSALDRHARQNTTSVYTVAEIFPMLPEKLSTDLTSLNFGEDRLALVMEMTVSADGSIPRFDIFEATVRNRAKLSYNAVAAWLDANGPIPPAIAAVPGLEENLRLQHLAATQLKTLRHTRGALDFETTEARPVFADGKLQELAAVKKNRAKDLIEDLMIAANGVTASFLERQNLPSLRRVVRTPKQWDRILEIAKERGAILPVEPDPKALEAFLVTQKQRDPQHFADLSLSVIKLLGAGEYVVDLPGKESPGHFGLAVKDYAHSTAPNRRFPDLISQRLVKASLAGSPPPYSATMLEELAVHCTKQEDAAKKVERQVIKAAAALLLQSRLGESFDAIVTGASPKGTWVRITQPLVEGKLVRGFAHRKVGQRLRVKLVHVDAEHGLIDFESDA